MEADEAHKKKKQKWTMLITIGIFLLIAIGVFIYWYGWWRFEKFTDDAYVSGNIIELTPQVSGIVTGIYADDTDFVEKNQVIVTLDETDYQLSFEMSLSQLANTVRNVVQLFENVKRLEAQILVNEAELVRAEQDFQNRVDLVEIGGVSLENFEHVEADLKRTAAALEATRHELLGAYALVQNTTVDRHPLVQNAKEKVVEAYVNLRRCKIVAPTSGFIAKRSTQLGEYVTDTTPLLAVIPLDEIWVNANFKEVQLSKMRIGQHVKMTSDLYGDDVVYNGHVVGISAGTGSVFSVLPPQNATGNWIKIVQRLPVRVSLDPEQIKKYPLRIGLSMDVTVNVRNTQGEMLAAAKQLKPIYTTDVYKKQEMGVERLIEDVITKNR